MEYSHEALEILFEDKHIIVVKKPAGIPSESAEISRTDMVSALKNHRVSKGEKPEIFIAHRLDQPVEGIMVFAKNGSAASRLSRDIREDRFKKVYLAACYPMKDGIFMQIDAANYNADVSMALEDNLLRGSGNRVSVVPKDTKGSKRAYLIYTPLREEYELKEGHTGVRLLRVELITGRHHQIRVQLSNAGLPIIGDRKYGCMPGNYRGPLCLAAAGLTFVHPASNKAMHFEMTPGFMDQLERKTKAEL